MLIVLSIRWARSMPRCREAIAQVDSRLLASLSQNRSQHCSTKIPSHERIRNCSFVSMEVQTYQRNTQHTPTHATQCNTAQHGQTDGRMDRQPRPAAGLSKSARNRPAECTLLLLDRPWQSLPQLPCRTIHKSSNINRVELMAWSIHHDSVT